MAAAVPTVTRRRAISRVGQVSEIGSSVSAMGKNTPRRSARRRRSPARPRPSRPSWLGRSEPRAPPVRPQRPGRPQAPNRPQINPCMTKERIDHNRNNSSRVETNQGKRPRRPRRPGPGRAPRRAFPRSPPRMSTAAPGRPPAPGSLPRHRPSTPKVNAPFRAAASVEVARPGSHELVPHEILLDLLGGDDLVDGLADREGEQSGQEPAEHCQPPRPAEPRPGSRRSLPRASACGELSGRDPPAPHPVHSNSWHTSPRRRDLRRNGRLVACKRPTYPPKDLRARVAATGSIARYDRLPQLSRNLPTQEPLPETIRSASLLSPTAV